MGQNSFILNDNFGIGTSDPLSPLDVRFSNTSLPTTGSGSIIRLGNTDLTTSSTSSIIFLGYDAGGTQRHGAAISWLKTGSWTAGGNNYGSTLIFSTRADAGDTVERIRITSTGAISFGATGTNYGSSGQFLTSQGNASPTWTTVSYSTLTLNTSGTGLSGSTTYTPAGATTFTVTSNATNANTPSAIVARDASGNFIAGTITASLTGNATTATTASACSGNAATATTANALATANTYQVNGLGVGTAPSATAGEIRALNDITAFYGLSDRRLKENISPLKNVLSKLKNINGYNFNYKTRPNQKMVGVIAQELLQEYPELIYETAPLDKGTGLEKVYAVRYELLTSILLQAVKELSYKISKLENE